METRRAEKILLIEDEAPVRSSIRDIFEFNGYKVFSSDNGHEGIQLAKEIDPDLIICDVNMPGKNGFDVAEELNLAKGEKAIPFIFLTARTDINDLRKGMSLGADEYIFKPFRAKELLAIVELRLDRIKRFRQEGGVSAGEAEKLSYEDRVMLEYKGKTELVNLKEIIFFEADSEYTNVYLLNRKPILVRRLLKDWESMLPDDNFFRVHRSTIVNLNKITKIEKGFKKNFIIKLDGFDKPINVSQRFAVLLRNKFGF